METPVTTKIDTFFARYRLRTYAKGQVLLLGGENTGTMYHLATGRVKMYDVTYRGDEVILNTFKPPAFFPMALAINGGDSPYIYEAETDVELHQAPAEEVLAFVKDNPDVMYDLLSRLYTGVDGLVRRMSLLMGGSARGRLIYEILLEARRFGEQRTDNGCTLQVSEKSIGTRAGLSRETVSREIHKLKQDKIIEVRGKTVVVCDMRALERLLGQEL